MLNIHKLFNPHHLNNLLNRLESFTESENQDIQAIAKTSATPASSAIASSASSSATPDISVNQSLDQTSDQALAQTLDQTPDQAFSPAHPMFSLAVPENELERLSTLQRYQ